MYMFVYPKVIGRRFISHYICYVYSWVKRAFLDFNFIPSVIRYGKCLHTQNLLGFSVGLFFLSFCLKIMWFLIYNLGSHLVILQKQRAKTIYYGIERTLNKRVYLAV